MDRIKQSISFGFEKHAGYPTLLIGNALWATITGQELDESVPVVRAMPGKVAMYTSIYLFKAKKETIADPMLPLVAAVLDTITSNATHLISASHQDDERRRLKWVFFIGRKVQIHEQVGVLEFFWADGMYSKACMTSGQGNDITVVNGGDPRLVDQTLNEIAEGTKSPNAYTRWKCQVAYRALPSSQEPSTIE